ncbi:MAG: hypothetical protein Q7U89_06450, partial [Coriobacteriia bacterium]|nr:hypothetical protein [Coriobacteriia bacterium]
MILASHLAEKLSQARFIAIDLMWGASEFGVVSSREPPAIDQIALKDPIRLYNPGVDPTSQVIGY